MFNLFITDLDGTLLDDEKNISHVNLEAIKRIRKNDVAFSIFTGRNFYSAYQYMKILNVEGLVALQNGALIIEMPSRKVINEICLQAEIAVDIYQFAKKNPFTIICFMSYQDYIKNPAKDMIVEKNNCNCMTFDEYLQHNHERITTLDSLENYLIMNNKIGQLAIVGKKTQLSELLSVVSQKYQSQISHVLSPIEDHCGFLEFFGPKVSKGDALDYLLKHHGTTAAKTVFIGDNYNDLPLMKKVGLPIATENAPREIKDHCKMVVSSNNNHAVKDAIKKIFF